MTSLTNPPLKEEELREWERLAEEASELPSYRRFYDAARTGWPRTIAEVRAKDREIEELRKRYEATLRERNIAGDKVKRLNREIEELRQFVGLVDGYCGCGYTGNCRCGEQLGARAWAMLARHDAAKGTKP